MGVVFGGIGYGVEAIRNHNIIKPEKVFKYDPKKTHSENLNIYEQTMKKSEDFIKSESEKLLKKQKKGRLS